MEIRALINIFVPIITALVFFYMAIEIKRVSKVRALIFGEIGYKKVFTAFLMFGIYFATRPLQNLIGPHPWPMIMNSARQFFLMAVIAPAIFVSILHWVPSEKGTSKALEYAAFAFGFFSALIFILINNVAIAGSKEISSFFGMKVYDAVWFSIPQMRIELMIVHLITQLISPVGFFVLSAAYVRHRRHNYTLSEIYNLMPLKWKYLETGLLVFTGAWVLAGIVAIFGGYHTYLWLIYFGGSIVAGMIELRGVQLPPREAPADMKNLSARS